MNKANKKQTNSLPCQYRFLEDNSIVFHIIAGDQIVDIYEAWTPWGELAGRHGKWSEGPFIHSLENS